MVCIVVLYTTHTSQYKTTIIYDEYNGANNHQVVSRYGKDKPETNNQQQLIYE
jgi:hypothetical protein